MQAFSFPVSLVRGGSIMPFQRRGFTPLARPYGDNPSTKKHPSLEVHFRGMGLAMSHALRGCPICGGGAFRLVARQSAGVQLKSRSLWFRVPELAEGGADAVVSLARVSRTLSKRRS